MPEAKSVVPKKKLFGALTDGTIDLLGSVFDGDPRDWRPAIWHAVADQAERLQQGEKLEVQVPLLLFTLKPGVKLNGKRLVVTAELRFEFDVPFIELAGQLDDQDQPKIALVAPPAEPTALQQTGS